MDQYDGFEYDMPMLAESPPLRTPTIERSNSLALECEVERLRSKLNFVISSAEQSLQDFSQAQAEIQNMFVEKNNVLLQENSMLTEENEQIRLQYKVAATELDDIKISYKEAVSLLKRLQARERRTRGVDVLIDQAIGNSSYGTISTAFTNTKADGMLMGHISSPISSQTNTPCGKKGGYCSPISSAIPTPLINTNNDDETEGLGLPMTEVIGDEELVQNELFAEISRYSWEKNETLCVLTNELAQLNTTLSDKEREIQSIRASTTERINQLQSKLHESESLRQDTELRLGDAEDRLLEEKSFLESQLRQSELSSQAKLLEAERQRIAVEIREEDLQGSLQVANNEISRLSSCFSAIQGKFPRDDPSSDSQSSDGLDLIALIDNLIASKDSAEVEAAHLRAEVITTKNAASEAISSHDELTAMRLEEINKQWELDSLSWQERIEFLQGKLQETEEELDTQRVLADQAVETLNATKKQLAEELLRRARATKAQGIAEAQLRAVNEAAQSTATENQHSPLTSDSHKPAGRATMEGGSDGEFEDEETIESSDGSNTENHFALNTNSLSLSQLRASHRATKPKQKPGTLRKDLLQTKLLLKLRENDIANLRRELQLAQGQGLDADTSLLDGDYGLGWSGISAGSKPNPQVSALLELVKEKQQLIEHLKVSTAEESKILRNELETLRQELDFCRMPRDALEAKLVADHELRSKQEKEMSSILTYNLQNESFQLKQQLDELKERNQHLVEQVEEQADYIRQLEGDLDQCLLDLTAQEERSEMLSESVTDLKLELAQMQESLALAQGVEEQLRHELDLLKEELDLCHNDNVGLTDKLVVRDEDIHRLEDEYRVLHVDYDNMTDRFNAMKTDLKQHNDELEREIVMLKDKLVRSHAMEDNLEALHKAASGRKISSKGTIFDSDVSDIEDFKPKPILPLSSSIESTDMASASQRIRELESKLIQKGMELENALEELQYLQNTHL